MDPHFDSTVGHPTFDYNHELHGKGFDLKKFENPFVGGFGCRRPGNLVDQQVYFVCLHNALTQGGQSALFSNVSLVVNNTYQFDFDASQWQFNDYLYIGSENNFRFQTGDTVCLYVNGYPAPAGQWVCDIAKPLAQDILNCAQQRWQSMSDDKKARIYFKAVRGIFGLAAKLCRKIR